MAERCLSSLNIDKQINISGDKSISTLLSYINSFNSYLDEININNNYCNIKNLIIKFNETINKDIDKNKNINDFVSPILININTIISYYKEFDKTLLESNSMVHYYFIYAIYKSIIILFTYYYYLDNIYKYLLSETIEFTDIINDDDELEYLGKEDTIILTNFIKYMLINVVNSRASSIKINLDEFEELNALKETCKNFNSATDEQIELIDQCDIVYILKNIYTHICVKFNEIILTIEQKNIKFSYIKQRIDFIKSKLLLNDIYKEIRQLIVAIYDLENENNFSLGKNDYITIPQYTSVCWYISILTGMCYSDLSKKLLLDRINNRNYNTSDEENNTFINIIKYIINNITKDCKRYSDNLTDNCEFFLYFKNNLLDFFLNKLNKLRETIYDEIIIASTPEDKTIIFKKYFTDIFVNKDYYIIDLLLNYIKAKYGNKEIDYNTILSKEITIDDLIKTNITLGINTYGYLILNTLYNIFNVNTLFIYHISHDYIKFKNPNNPNPDANPDIIFIQEINKLDNASRNISKSSNVEKITDINYENDKDNIIYNGNNYKLDYILYRTINMEKCDIATGCGHCISCIHYDNIKYYHDSRFPLQVITCNDDKNIRIPCSLIRQDWNNHTTTYFTTDKCFSRDANISSDAFIIENKSMVSEQLIYSKDTSLIRVYVKEVVTGGGNNKYKSMYKKINIMNNKKIIERTIYIDNNKNKFITPLHI
jgi:hypothetical protein